MDLEKQYQEVEIWFDERQRDGSFPFRLRSPFLQFGGMFRTKLREEEVNRALASVDRFSDNWVQRSAPRETLDPVKEIGADLFSALSEASITEVFKMAEDQARSMEMGVRLRLGTRNEFLANLPWEFLYDPSRRDFVALSSHTSIVRQSEEFLTDALSRPPIERVRVLLFTSQLGGDGSLYLEGIDHEIEALSNMGISSRLDLRVIKDGGREMFQNIIEREPFEVVIFSGSGVGSGEAQSILFPIRNKGQIGQGGSVEKMKVNELVELMHDKINLRLVYLSACNTDFAAKALSRVIPAAIGMRGEITDLACVAFTTKLLDTALKGHWLDDAISDGRRAIDLREPGNRDWGMPVCYLGLPGGLRIRATGPEESSSAGNPSSFTYEASAVVSRERAPRRRPLEEGQRQLGEFQTLLMVYEQNVDDLNKQISTSGSASPLYLQSQLKDAEKKVEELKSQIKALRS
jgi:hypothetical protein